jgi:hypothetical protein
MHYSMLQAHHIVLVPQYTLAALAELVECAAKVYVS